MSPSGPGRGVWKTLLAIALTPALTLLGHGPRRVEDDVLGYSVFILTPTLTLTLTLTLGVWKTMSCEPPLTPRWLILQEHGKPLTIALTLTLSLTLTPILTLTLSLSL